MINQDRLVSQFIELIQVDSESTNEAEIGKLLMKKFGDLGLQVEQDDAKQKIGHGHGNLFCMLPATAGMENVPTIFFTSHMDTVTPGKGIKPQIGQDGIIRSDGTTILGSDDKAGLTVMLEALKVMQEQNIPHGNIQFVITVGEEVGLKGARAIDPNRMKAQFGYAIDSNGEIGAIAVAAPARAEIDIKFFGKSAHAGVNPEDGVSAINVASKAVSRMPLGRIDNETTANIGSFAGGGALNVVCDFVQLTAEARSIVQDKLVAQLDAMQKACESAAAEYGARCEFNGNIVYPAFMFDDASPVVQLASRVIDRNGFKPRTFHSGGGSDANIFNGMGIPTVNLSVGYQEIHTTAEHIAIVDMVNLTKIVVGIIQEVTQNAK